MRQSSKLVAICSAHLQENQAYTETGTEEDDWTSYCKAHGIKVRCDPAGASGLCVAGVDAVISDAEEELIDCI